MFGGVKTVPVVSVAATISYSPKHLRVFFINLGHGKCFVDYLLGYCVNAKNGLLLEWKNWNVIVLQGKSQSCKTKKSASCNSN